MSVGVFVVDIIISIPLERQRRDRVDGKGICYVVGLQTSVGEKSRLVVLMEEGDWGKIRR